MDQHPYDEKENEKSYEKEEKERAKHEEKTIDEKFRRDPLGTSTWALILILAGVVFTADNMGMLDQFIDSVLPAAYSDLRIQPWTIVLLGAALLFILEAVLRLLIPGYRAHVGGTLVLAALMIGLVIGTIFDNWTAIGPLILIAIGITILFRGMRRAR